MKKTRIHKNNIFFIFLSLCLFLFNSACGLEEYIIIAEPSGINHQPNYDSLYADRYFEFRTNENLGEDGSDRFNRTEVYYKIYNNRQTMINEYAQLENLASDDDKKSTSYSTMINKGFKLLKSDNDYTYLIPANKTKNSQTVYIRLTDYLNIDNFSAKVIVDDEFRGKPVRCEEGYTFNFGNSGEKDVIPGTGAYKEDCLVSSTATSSGTWYVSMFAVSAGLDTTLSPLYSNILYLGNVSIVENSNMN